MHDKIESVYESLNYAFFEEGDLNLNLFGIRADVEEAGEFDDYLGCFYKEDGSWVLKLWHATTDPGARLLKRPINSKGCAILVPGQYRGAYRIGNHWGYPALVQVRPVKVYRDTNKDTNLDWDPDVSSIDEGYFGINIHRAKEDVITPHVAGYSAGCQVHQDSANFDEMMVLCRRAADMWSNSFTYTLFTEEQAGFIPLLAEGAI